MSNLKNELKNIMVNAIDSFNREEDYLIKNDLSERCICARFAMHLTSALQATAYSDYVVDVEYNRGADGIERSTKRLYDSPITVDLIVHKRGYGDIYGFNNLICAEMKKSTDRRGCADDEARLKNMIDHDFGFCYITGFMIIVNMENCILEIKEQY